MEFTVFLIKASHKIYGIMPVMEFQPLRSHKLRRHNEHMAAVQREEIRALPHLSISAAVGVKNAFKLPFHGIRRRKQGQLPASIRVQTSNYGIKGIFFLPDSRIAEIYHRASLRQGVTFDNRIAGQLFVVDAVAYGNTLGLPYFMCSVLLQPVIDAGIHQDMFSAVLHRAP